MVSKNVEKAASQELADLRAEANGYVIEERDLRDIKTLDEAFSFINDQLGGVEDFADYGTGFVVLDKRGKDRLVGTPFVILEWRFVDSKQFKGEFVSLLVITEGNEKFIVNDGSTGICKQLRAVTDDRIKAGRSNPQVGLAVKAGLRRSDYETVDSDGEELSASTYYLA